MNRNIYEEQVDNLMLEVIREKLDEVKREALIDKLKNLPLEQKRLGILGLLDDDRNLLMSIKDLIKTPPQSKVEHISKLVEHLRTYVKVADTAVKDYGEVMTPIELVEEMLDVLPEDVWSNPDLKWLDNSSGCGTFPAVVVKRLMKGLEAFLVNEEERYRHIIENMIYVCELQPKNLFLHLVVFDIHDKYLLNIYNGDFLGKGFDEHMKTVWELDKFDIIVANPPYTNSIDLKFLEKSYKIADKVLFVHPSTWLIDEKMKQAKFNKARKLVKDHLKYIRMFNGNGIFGISLFVPCVVTYVDKEHKGNITLVDEINNVTVEYDDIFKINKYNTKEYESIKGKLESNKDTINNYTTKVSGSWWVNLSQIRGNVNLGKGDMLKTDFYTLLTKNKTVETFSRQQREKTQYSFNTELEAENFLSYVKTKFVRFALSIYKNNANLYCGEVDLIPWLDFTKEWTDASLCKEFNITKEEWEFIDKVIPNYY